MRSPDIASRSCGTAGPRRPLHRCLTSVGAAAILRPLFADLDREQFLVCGLDAKHCIIGVNVVSIGSLTLSIVHPREVFKPLILMNAAAWICAHNHPSGDITPSPEDRVLTSRLRQGAELLGITLARPSHPHRRALLQLRRSRLARCVRA